MANIIFEPEYALRVGRLPLPIFLISDSRTVGFSQPQVRPPVEMYGAFYLYHYDGADLTWTTSFAGTAVKSQLYIGATKPRLPADASLSVSPLAGVNVTAESGELTVRASYNRGKGTASSPALDAAFEGIRNGFPPGALYPGSPGIPGDPALANRYGLTDKIVTYSSLGLNYDPGRWFVTSELGAVSAVGVSAHETLGYVTAGTRIGAFTPYATVARFKDKIAGSTTGNLVVDALRIGSATSSQKTIGVGLRWDAMKNLDFKGQFDHARPDAGASGFLVNTQENYRPGMAYNVVSVSSDFVF